MVEKGSNRGVALGDEPAYSSGSYVQLNPTTFQPDEKGEWFARDADQGEKIVRASHCQALGVHIRKLSSDQLVTLQKEERRNKGVELAYRDLLDQTFSFDASVNIPDKQPI